MCNKTIMQRFFAVAVAASAVSAQADVFKMPSGDPSLQSATVGDPGNVSEQAQSFH